MKRICAVIDCFSFSCAAFLVMAATVLFMPLAVESRNTGQTFIIAVGLIFWISALLGYCAVTVAGILRRKILKTAKSSALSLKGRVGLFSFFSNVSATVADLTMIASAVLFVIVNITELKTSYFAYIVLFLLIFSIHMHCLLNGKIFKLIKSSKNIRHDRREKNHE